MAEVYLLLGSNVGNSVATLAKARALIALHGCVIVKTSGLYQTQAWGLTAQDNFINQAVHVTTSLPPGTLLNTLKDIERQLGRVETVKWGPRVIDIDILLYDDMVIDTAHLKVPHPFMQQRSFTLVPLNEIADGVVHPLLHKTISKLLDECEDKLQVQLIK